MSAAVPYSVPEESGALPSILLAIAVHAALLAFLWFGVRWQNETPVAIEAEVWDVAPSEAAPPPPPAPEPVVVKETPKPVETPAEKPDIVLEQEKRKKQEQLQREEQEQLQREEEARKEAEAEAKKKQELKEKALLEKTRQEAMNRMMTQADAGNGAAAKTQGARGDPDYANRIAAKIRSNTVFPPPPGLDSDPEVEYAVELLPDGSLRGVRLIKPSGLPGFDEAVRNAIDKSQPFPADKSGRVPPEVIVDHKLKEQE